MQKTLGFVLLAVGLFIIAASLVLSWQIFTGANPVPELFSLPQTLKTDSALSIGSLEDLGQQLPDLLAGQLQGLLPVEAIPQMLNLAAWSMFASLLLFGGSLVSGIGVKLVK